MIISHDDEIINEITVLKSFLDNTCSTRIEPQKAALIEVQTVSEPNSEYSVHLALKGELYNFGIELRDINALVIGGYIDY